MFSQRAIKKDSAGAAGTSKTAIREKISGLPAASAARGRLREPTKRRKLTKPGKGQTAVQVPPSARPDLLRTPGSPVPGLRPGTGDLADFFISPART
jgi:hypothetical protein